MRKTTHLVRDVTLPATGVDETDNLPIGITKTLHMPQFIMVFTSFDVNCRKLGPDILFYFHIIYLFLKVSPFCTLSVLFP